MSLEEKINEITRVFNELDTEVTQFQNWSGLHCKFGCGKCCLKPDIEATPLEFLPFAHYLYVMNVAEEWYDKLRVTDSSICMIFNPDQRGAGLCTEYKHRGLICRLFGYSARTNKYGKKELVTCEVIKSEQQDNYLIAASRVEANGGTIPLLHAYYMKLHAIDSTLGKEFYPINVAIYKALEIVMAYYAYRKA